MAAAIKNEYNVEAELIGGGGGIFDVVVDSELTFSKHEQGRFPEEAEILDRLARHDPARSRAEAKKLR